MRIKQIAALCVFAVCVSGCASHYAVEPPLEDENPSVQKSLKEPPQSEDEAAVKAEEDQDAQTAEPQGFGPSTFAPDAGSTSTHPQGTENSPATPGVDGFDNNSAGN